jgi:hypothetical protein
MPATSAHERQTPIDLVIVFSRPYLNLNHTQTQCNVNGANGRARNKKAENEARLINWFDD